MATTLADLLLRKQAKELSMYPLDYFSAGLADQGNSLLWDVIIFGPQGSVYEGGFFQAKIEFSDDYPDNPPTVKFTTEMWHPNVYPDGTVCMSILSPPGDDPYGYELAGERWLPIHTVETILLGVVSLLWEPNDEAAANVDAAIEWRERRDEYAKRVLNLVRRSQCRFLFGEDTEDDQFFSGGATRVDEFSSTDATRVENSFSGGATRDDESSSAGAVRVDKSFSGSDTKVDKFFSVDATRVDKSFFPGATKVDKSFFTGDVRKAKQYFSGGPSQVTQFLFGNIKKDYELSNDYAKADEWLSSDDEEEDNGETRIVIFD